jgi:1-deoxyxylulose-5-phosphate synthase
LEPVGRGRLTRPWDEQTARSGTDRFGSSLYPEEDREVAGRTLEVAERLGVGAAQVALAWLLSKPVVTAPIVGATKPEHLADAVAAVELELSPADVAALEEPYRPHPVAGHV